MSIYEFQPSGMGIETGSELSPADMYIPPAVVPPFARKIGALASEIGFANAVVDVFGDANISFEVEGDLSPAAGQGLVVAGDHSQRIEPFLVQAAMSQSDRDASRVVAMPISFAGRLMQSTEAGKSLIIPVIPTRFASENRFPLSDPRNIVRRARHPQVLNQPKASLQRVNAKAMTAATEYAASGDAVTIFPTGGSAANQWRIGIGQILNGLPVEARANTQVAGLQADPFSVKGIMSSLLLRDMGIRPKRRTIVLNAHLLGSAEELADSHDGNGQVASAQAVTESVRKRYNQHFARI
jgi:hypothetical protein